MATPAAVLWSFILGDQQIQVVLSATASARLVLFVSSRAPGWWSSTHPCADFSTASRPPRLRTNVSAEHGNAAQLPWLSLLSILHSHPDVQSLNHPLPIPSPLFDWTQIHSPLPFSASAPMYPFLSSSTQGLGTRGARRSHSQQSREGFRVHARRLQLEEGKAAGMNRPDRALRD
ncbi:hypothetical protein B0H19DRAFT_1381080 [Mycena capillaripes]|nr:hypothetical protein B0H19DRAFT_1381080 [Mycena capillaripes]